jgi:hypothetical protein
MLAKWCWGMLAVIHIVPAFAAFRPSLLTKLYGVQSGSIAYLLLQHRAALFIGIFATCCWAIMRPESRQIAVILVGISMLSFLALFVAGERPSQLRVIAIFDLIGLPFLCIAGWLAFKVTTMEK